MVWQQAAGNGSAFVTLTEQPPVKLKRTDKITPLLEAGIKAHESGEMERALSAYRQVMGLDKDNVGAMTAAALIHADRGEHEAADFLLRRSLQVAPTVVAYNTLGYVSAARRDFDGAINSYRASLELDPTNLTTWPNLIFTLDLHPYASPELRLSERRRFNDLHCKALTEAAEPHANDPDPERPLRIGYVSGDFKQHSAAHGFGPVIMGHHKDQYQTYLYDVDQAVPNPEDQVSGWFKGLASVWRDARGVADHVLAEMIRADRIDVLVDLSGYSGGGRALVFARKPAPIQVTGFGYATGLGIDAMDYVIGDDTVIPEHHERFYHEKVLRLPCFMAYEKAPPWPEIVTPPKERNGYVTYGYLGRVVKISPQTLAAWAEILTRVPDARMLFKSGEYADEALQRQVQAGLGALGVAPDRLEFRAGSARLAHLEAYNEIDISLDPFPHNGGVTTVESFLCGVPTVTVLGNYLCGRTGASIMQALGLKHAVARTPFEYVNHAVSMAADTWTYEDRMALRMRVMESVLFSEDAYASAVEEQYRTIWRAWCDQQTATGPRD
jgi:protein O-GlcNAc transferase